MVAMKSGGTGDYKEDSMCQRRLVVSYSNDTST